MIRSFIQRVIRLRLWVCLLVAIGVVASAWAISRAPLDAIPDISDPQIIVYAKWPRSPELLERQVTEPIVKALSGAPDVRAVRGVSHMGYSFIYVILSDTSRRAQTQQIITDRLNGLRAQLPSDAQVTLGPNASSMGWIFQYALVDRQQVLDLRDLRLLNQSTIRTALQNVPGVAEVVSVGGLEKQYQVKLFPPLLAETGLTVRQVANVLQSAGTEVGGRTLEVTNRDYQIRGSILSDDAVLDSAGALEDLVVGRDRDGKDVQLKDVGYVQVGSDQRRGIADLDGKGEVVGGIVVMEQKQNALRVANAVKAEIAKLRKSLPEGVEIVMSYDRSTLIWTNLKHFFATLAYELAVVIVVALLFLRNLRTAIAPVAILLLSTLFTGLPLATFHQTINLFSLGGLFIAIGEMVDATIVIVENCAAELAARGRLSAEQKREVVIRSIANVARPLLFSLLIILASFLPVFFLGEKEGRLFDPLAYTKTFAMAFSTVLTVVLLPIIAIWIFKGDVVKPSSHWELGLATRYRRTVQAAMRARYAVLAIAILLLAVSAVMFSGFRRDFMPELEEGSILYMPSTLPGLPAREGGWVLQKMDERLKDFPEVERVFGKLGRADSATDAAPVSMIESTVLLKPASQWRPGMTKAKLVAEMDRALQIPGYVNSWVQPISARVMMQDTGLQTPVGIKIKGPDIATIEQIGAQVEAALRKLPATGSAIAERASSGYFIDLQFDPARLSEAGINADDALATARYAVGGDNVAALLQDGGASIPVSLQYSPEYIDTLEKIRSVSVVGASGRTVPLRDISEAAIRKMPEMLRNDDGMLTGYVFVTTKDMTPTDYVDQVRPLLKKAVSLPDGYSLEWTGDYKNADRARAQLALIVPVTLVIIFVLLLLAFKSVTDALLILLSVPFALVGGVFLQWLLGYSMTTAVVIGYIALFAVAIQTGIIMVIFIRQALARRRARDTYLDAVLDGSALRLRPKLMTVAATTLSLLPVMLSSGEGLEIMKPIATPTIGGMVSSTIYVLFLIPCLFAIGQDIESFRRRRRKAKKSQG